MSTSFLLSSFSALALLTSGGAAFAEGGERGEATDLAAFAAAKVTLSDAVTTAEQSTGAKALEASLEPTAGVPVFVVTVVKDNTLQSVLVDAATGQVTTTAVVDDRADDGDRDDHHHRGHDDGDGDDDRDGDEEDAD